MVVLPGPVPVTTPLVETVATLGLALLHIPPPVPPVAERVVPDPAQRVFVPLITLAVTKGFTVTAIVAATGPQPLSTV
jgi:hypothetical protein